MSLKYNEFQYAQHAGSFPDTHLLDNVSKALGPSHIVLGCPSLINPCGVSFRDLVRLGDSDSPLDQISLDSLLLKGLKVLKNRLAVSTEAHELDLPTYDAAAHALLSRTLSAHSQGEDLVVFLVPNFHSRKIWIKLVNRHFNNQVEGSLPVCKVHILEEAGGELNVHNTPRETGLLSRHVEGGESMTTKSLTYSSHTPAPLPD